MVNYVSPLDKRIEVNLGGFLRPAEPTLVGAPYVTSGLFHTILD